MTTPSTIALSELAAKGADADFIKQALQFALQCLVEMDDEAMCKAAYGELNEDSDSRRVGRSIRSGTGKPSSERNLDGRSPSSSGERTAVTSSR